MNRNIFENNLRIIKESKTKQSKEINPLQDEKFVKWLRENNLLGYLK